MCSIDFEGKWFKSGKMIIAWGFQDRMPTTWFVAPSWQVYCMTKIEYMFKGHATNQVIWQQATDGFMNFATLQLGGEKHGHEFVPNFTVIELNIYTPSCPPFPFWHLKSMYIF